MSIFKKIELTNTPSEKFGKNLTFASKEAFNLLRTNLAFSLIKDKENIGHVIGVTSSEPQDGKSYNSINIAYSFAEDGHKVLLIDADMRKPVIDKYVILDPVPGLSNCLVDNISFDQMPIHHNVLIDGLDLLLSGNIPPNASVLLSSNQMRTLISSLKEHYDYIIIDCPPVNIVSDSLIASKYFDGIVLVVRHNKTKKKEINEAIRQLTFVKANILGIIYNGYYSDRKSYYKDYKNKYYYKNKINKETQK